MSSPAGRLEAIWIKPAKGSPMEPRARAQLRTGKGLVGNRNQGGRRQVTIIERERWDDMMEELGIALDPSERRANLMTCGISLAHTHQRVLRIGACRLRVLGETRPCEVMDKAYPGLQKSMEPDWRGGAFAEILDDGEISVGDRVEWDIKMTNDQ